jgi:hypothetical protein
MTYETFDIHVCIDCAMLFANGDAGDGVDHDALVQSIDEYWPTNEGWRIDVCEDGEDFSWSWCDACGSNLGGSRMHATAWRKVGN